MANLDAAYDLGMAIYAVDNVLQTSRTIKDDDNLPEAFLCVKKHLPIVKKSLDSIRSRLTTPNAGQNGQSYEKYCLKVAEAANNSVEGAKHLYKLFLSITCSDKDRLVAYRNAVAGGDNVEDAMKKLLNNINGVAREPFMSQEVIDELRNAIMEVEVLNPSLEPVASQGLNITNSGPGILPVHTGKGNVNINSGSAPQMNGPISSGATFNFAAPAQDKPGS